jgi:DNA-binding CsgD family transcriptional regulator
MGTTDSVAEVLSRQQRAVLGLSATGMVTADVAAVLGAPIEEVRAFLKSAMVVLGARSKLEAVIIALRHGLIQLPAADHIVP